MIETKLFRFVDGKPVEVAAIEKGYSHIAVLIIDGLPVYTHIVK